MELAELLKLLKEQNESEAGFQIHLNSGDLSEKSLYNTDVEFRDVYFTNCSVLPDSDVLVFSNEGKQPVSIDKETNQPLYPCEINSGMYIDMNKIETIENVEARDWFMIPSSKVINLYMFPENKNIGGHRNVVTVGFIE